MMKKDDLMYQYNDQGAEAGYNHKLEGNMRKHPPGTKFRKDGEPCKYRGRKLGQKNVKPKKTRKEIKKAYRAKLKER